MSGNGVLLPIPDDRMECDVCHRPIGRRGFTLVSPIAGWGYFACLCPEHATPWARLVARAQRFYARRVPW